MWTIFSVVAIVISFYIQLVCCYPANNSSGSDDQLVFVNIVYRHGDRNIVRSYPKDPWSGLEFWPERYGELTNLGKKQTFELGLYLRRRYHNLIANNGSYNRNNIYVQSTDVDRTLMSASYCLAGMFPPKNEQIWHESLFWQAIPIHTIPEKIDEKLAMKRHCPLYNKAYDEYEESEKIKSIFKENQELIEYLEKNAGKRFSTIFELKEFYETLWIENLKNFTLPEWTKTVFPDGKLKEFARFSYLMNTKTTLMKRLRVGFLIREIFERLTKKENAKLEHSIWMYSAHDLTIVAILDTLNLFEMITFFIESQPLPDYAATLFFELHKSNGSYHVEIIYNPCRGEEKGPLEPLFIPNCGQRCPLKRLYEIYRDIIPIEDFDIECQLHKVSDSPKAISSSSSNFSSIWLVIGLAAILIYY